MRVGSRWKGEKPQKGEEVAGFYRWFKYEGKQAEHYIGAVGTTYNNGRRTLRKTGAGRV